MPKKSKRAIPSSQALRFIDSESLEEILATMIPDEGDRAFVKRCLIAEGPLHHRGANYLILVLLGRLVKRIPGDDSPPKGELVPMLLPPHLESEVEDGSFPIQLPTAALSDLLGHDEAALSAAVDCLTDGPPQHSLANVVTIALLDRLWRRLR